MVTLLPCEETNLLLLEIIFGNLISSEPMTRLTLGGRMKTDLLRPMNERRTDVNSDDSSNDMVLAIELLSLELHGPVPTTRYFFPSFVKTTAGTLKWPKDLENVSKTHESSPQTLYSASSK